MYLRLSLLALCLLAGLPARAGEPAAVVRTAIDEVIRPGYDAFAAKAGALSDATETLCREPTFASLEAAHRAFAEALAAWGRIEFIQFGPVREDNRLERLMFVQDRKGIALRQIQGILAAQQREDLAPGALHGKSVAVQGFPALEFVLFGTGAEQLGFGQSSYRCALGAAIAANIEAIAQELSEGWRDQQGIVAMLEVPGADNRLFRDGDEALAAILKVLPDGYELIAETRLNPFIGDGPDAAEPKKALFWRSANTLTLLRSNYEGLAAIAMKSGAMKDLAGDAAAIAANFPFENSAALSTLDAFKTSLPDAAQRPEGHDRLAYLMVVTKSLRDIAQRGILGAYDLSAGFSSLDGD
ncbi:MAG: imelysin family protein [Flavobacteriaceae bacterium]